MYMWKGEGTDGGDFAMELLNHRSDGSDLSFEAEGGPPGDAVAPARAEAAVGATRGEGGERSVRWRRRRRMREGSRKSRAEKAAAGSSEKRRYRGG